MVAPLSNTLSDQDAIDIWTHLIGFLRKRRAPEPDEIAQETLFRIVDKVRRGLTIEKPLAYAREVARHVLQEELRNYGREESLSIDVAAPSQAVSNEERLVCLEKCQGSLPRAECKLLAKYEQTDAAGRERLAKEIGISSDALRLRIHRIRSKLRTCVEACMARKAAK